MILRFICKPYIVYFLSTRLKYKYRKPLGGEDPLGNKRALKYSNNNDEIK